MPRSKSILAILLALSFFFNGAQAWFWRRNIVIGYAVVSKEDAEEINDDNELEVDPAPPYTLQLGSGFYLVNKPDNLPTGEDYWYCVVKSRKRKFNKVAKVYIPQYDAGQQILWAGDEEDILNYIENTAKISKPKEALRFSWAKFTDWQVQMAIPEDMVDDDDKLKLWAKCFDSQQKLKEVSKETIDWGTRWKIRGELGPKPGNSQL
ncbi:hypothetical protein LZ554_008126 [Drepanopeziza brunnea f. sp. 'monogermtubi']|nr:hypothetical protein LZ554_008126 [Drepanopeziza brunnea f. sp. 'monogermtubi']